MLFDDVDNTTQNLVIDSSGIDITTQAGAVTSLRDGKVGIGTSSPVCPLHVDGSTQPTEYTGDRILKQTLTGWPGTGPTYEYSTSARFSHYVHIASGGLILSSDSRIKTDISEVDIQECLDKVNSFNCKEYHYIDPPSRAKEKTIGFIAQEVAKVYPGAVGLGTYYLPDEMTNISNLLWNTIQVENDTNQHETKYAFTIPDLDLSGNNTGVCRFYVSNDLSGNDEVMKEIKVEPDNKTFIFDESWNNVFFYGKEVNDFHTIDKNKIFQLHHPAIQQLSRLNDEKTQEIATMQEKIANLEARLLALESK